MTEPMSEYQRGDMEYGQARAANDGARMAAQFTAAADDFIFNEPTMRPEEPVTAGLPFGDGPMFTQRKAEDERGRRERIARALESSSLADPDLLKFAQRIRRGE